MINVIAVVVLIMVIAFWSRALFFFLWVKVFGKSRNLTGYDPGAENYSKGSDESNEGQ